MKSSRYSQAKRSHHCERKKSSKQLIGSWEDTGKWIKCFNCGFHVDMTKVSTGDGNGLSYELFETVITAPYSVSEPLNIYKSTSVSGCPFCGTRNLP